VPALSLAKKDLWLRLRHYHFDHLVPPHLSDHVAACFGGADAATRAFAAKLSKKLGWSTRFALRAIEEYRKFLYLGAVADFGVTPSRIIDQVWHEHLLFTQGYSEFCRDVLGKRLEHHPELVATPEQTSTFASQYEATLDLYEDEFDRTPPADIWATPKFQQERLRARRALRKRPGSSPDVDSSDGEPLWTFFDGTPSCDGLTADAMSEFGGGGGFSGGGGGSSWGDSGSDSSDGCDSASDGGGDSGGGDGGGCSSGCGGGGCGGGE